MADIKTITIQQTVHRPHHTTIVRRWYDVVERTITRELWPDGSVASEVIDEVVIDADVDLEEEVLDTDVDVDADEVIEDAVADEADA